MLVRVLVGGAGDGASEGAGEVAGKGKGKGGGQGEDEVPLCSSRKPRIDPPPTPPTPPQPRQPHETNHLFHPFYPHHTTHITAGTLPILAILNRPKDDFYNPKRDNWRKLVSTDTTEARYQGLGVVSFLTLAADCLVREPLTPQPPLQRPPARTALQHRYLSQTTTMATDIANATARRYLALPPAAISRRYHPPLNRRPAHTHQERGRHSLNTGEVLNVMLIATVISIDPHAHATLHLRTARQRLQSVAAELLPVPVWPALAAERFSDLVGSHSYHHLVVILIQPQPQPNYILHPRPSAHPYSLPYPHPHHHPRASPSPNPEP